MEYKTAEGDRISLILLIKTEPEWARSRIESMTEEIECLGKRFSKERKRVAELEQHNADRIAMDESRGEKGKVV